MLEVSHIQEKQRNGQDRTRIHVTLPIELERRCREEAKNRGLTFSDVIVKSIEEREYFENIISEKDKIIRTNDEQIKKMILESLSEIRQTNFELNIVSKSLVSIPTVTEEARKINERSTKSAEIIGNFNVVTTALNESVLSVRNKMNEYHKVMESNKNLIDSLNKDINSIKNNLHEFLKSVREGLNVQKEKMLQNFTSDLRSGVLNVVNNEREKVFNLSSIFNTKISIIFSICVFLMFVMSCMFVYGYFSDVSKIKNEYVDLKNANSTYYNIMCKYKPPVPGWNYKTFCNE